MMRGLAVLTALAAVGGVVALVVLASGDREVQVAPPTGDPVVMDVSVSPSRYAFGERLVAEIELVIDSTRVDPGSVVTAAVFRPFRRLGPRESERLDLGRTTVLRFHYLIQCVDRACVPGAAERVIELPLGFVRYSPRQGDVVTLPLEWPTVEVASDLSPGVRSDVDLRPSALVAQAQADELPPLRMRGGSQLLGWLLVGAAALIVLAVGGWLAWRLWPRRSVPVVSEEPEQRPLEVALARIDRALANGGDEERRAALDVLARRLGQAGEIDLAGDARRLAWSEAGPQPDLVEALASAARQRTQAAA
jgi:hypothetical protein